MDNAKEMQALVKQKLKERLQSFETCGYQRKLSQSQGLSLLEDSKEIAHLSLAFVSSKFSGYGSLFGMYAVCKVGGGAVAGALKALDLSYNNPVLPDDAIFLANSLNEKFRFFGDRNLGHISFHPSDDVDKKCDEIVKKLHDLYWRRAVNLLKCELEVVDDVVAEQQVYQYPFATIVVICKLNDRLDLIPELAKKAKNAGCFDAKGQRFEEVIRKAGLESCFR